MRLTGSNITIVILVALGVLLICAGPGPSEQEQASAEYCSMTALWKEDEAAGVPIIDRRGWPDYKAGEVICPAAEEEAQ